MHECWNPAVPRQKYPVVSPLQTLKRRPEQWSLAFLLKCQYRTWTMTVWIWMCSWFLQRHWRLREVVCNLSSFQVVVFKDFYRLHRQVKLFLPLAQSLLDGLLVPLSTLPQAARCNYHPESMNSYCDNIVFWVNSKFGSKRVHLINVMLIHSTTFNSAKAL